MKSRWVGRAEESVRRFDYHKMVECPDGAEGAEGVLRCGSCYRLWQMKSDYLKKRALRCFKCHQIGHMKAKCPKRATKAEGHNIPRHGGDEKPPSDPVCQNQPFPGPDDAQSLGLERCRRYSSAYCYFHPYQFSHTTFYSFSFHGYLSADRGFFVF